MEMRCAECGEVVTTFRTVQEAQWYGPDDSPFAACLPGATKVTNLPCGHVFYGPTAQALTITRGSDDR